MKEAKFRVGEIVWDKVDEREMEVAVVSPPRPIGEWNYQLKFDRKRHKFTGTGTWRSEADLLPIAEAEGQ